MGEIMHEGESYSRQMVVDSALSSVSNNPVKNRILKGLFDTIKGWIGFRIGPVSAVSNTVTFTNSLISSASELHIFADNGKGSSNNANPSSWDTPLFYSSVSVDDTNHSVTYTFPASTVLSNTDFYLKIRNSWQSQS